MTIAAAYLTSEGFVLGADSATTISVCPPGGRATVGQLLRHSQKVFEVGEESRLGLCTWGSGGVKGTSHRTVVARLCEKTNDTTTVAAAKDHLVEIVRKVSGSAPGQLGVLGYYLGGWNPKTHEPACYQLVFQDGKEPAERQLPLGEASFSGAPQFFSRVFWGYDPRLRDRLKETLKARLGPDVKEFERLFTETFDEASRPLVAEGYMDLPIREAIDYVHAYLHITVKAFKFQFGVPVCGGPIEVAFISTDRRFRWVCHKGFESAIREEDGKSWTSRPSS